jgi:hypothetical protein
VAWQVTRNAQLSYFNNLQYKLIGHRNGGGTFAESRARNLNDKYPDVHQVKFTTPIRSKFVVDASYSRFRADDKFGQEPEVKAGDVSRFDSVSQTYTVALPTYRDLATFRDQILGSMNYFTGRHPVRLSVHDRRAEVVHVVDLRHACRLSKRRARFGQYLQRADYIDHDENPCGVFAGIPRQRSVRAGQVDADAQADDQRRPAVRDDVRIPAGGVPGSNDLRCRTLLP